MAAINNQQTRDADRNGAADIRPRSLPRVVAIEGNRVKLTWSIHRGACSTSTLFDIPAEFSQDGKARCALAWLVGRINDAEAFRSE